MSGPAFGATPPRPSVIDPDPQETAEWIEALGSLLRAGGAARVRQVMNRLAALAREPTVGWQPEPGTPYVNTIPAERQPAFPGDLAIEERLASLVRWNALAMVVRANLAYGELGGHIASYASVATLPFAPPAPASATWSSIRPIRRRASMRGPSSKAG
jgi:pyruvate dehydrogenase E1 component